MSARRIAILASGGGSNLQCIIEHFSRSPANSVGTVVLVGSNRTDSGALQRAHSAGIATHYIDVASSGAALLEALRAADAELLVLAGYLKLVPLEVVNAFCGRMLNVHPALLPAFGGHGMYGRRVHEAVIAAGVRLTGVTVHFVNEAFDRGAIAAQWPVAVLLDDNAQTLAARVLQVEHLLYPVVIEAVAAGTIALHANGRVNGSLPLTSPFATNVPTLFLT
ncbi:MAG: phosphoribosylglycinamide formyltransferase [Gemmatimonadota bacterium]|nr:phosphoribosylglycinamide formyltransferase [Gemmatimonadota bacterium]